MRRMHIALRSRLWCEAATAQWSCGFPGSPSVLNDRGITDLHILEKSVKVVKSDNLTQKTGRPPKPCPLIRLAILEIHG
jgi:hypothetical protein